MKKPLISVLLPAYNVDGYIESAVESILVQTLTNFELIIINDCSTDKTLDIVNKLAQRDKRIKVVNNSENMGIVKSLNIAIDLARGKYLARMDGDDLSKPDRLRIQYDAMESSSADITASSYELIDESGTKLNTHYVSTNQKDIIPLLHVSNPFVHGSVMMRSSFIREHELYYLDSYRHVEDYELWIRMIRAGASASLIPDTLYSWRINTRGVSATNSDIQADLTKKLQNILWDTNILPVTGLSSIRESKSLNTIIYPQGIAIEANNYLLEVYSMLCIALFKRKRFLEGLRVLGSLLYASPHSIGILIKTLA